MTISVEKNGMQRFIPTVEGCIFKNGNEELLKALNEILKTTGFTVAGGDLEKRALHLEVENMRCRSVCMSEKQVAQHLRQHLQIPSGYLFIGGVTC